MVMQSKKEIGILRERKRLGCFVCGNAIQESGWYIERRLSAWQLVVFICPATRKARTAPFPRHHHHQYYDDIIWNIWASHNFQVTFLEASFDCFWLTDVNQGEYEASFALLHFVSSAIWTSRQIRWSVQIDKGEYNNYLGKASKKKIDFFRK